MRIVVDRGSNAGAIAGYLHRADKREIGKEQDDPVFHTNMFGRDALERTEELRFSVDLNQRVERTYVHYKVSFPPGENPDFEEKKGIVDDLLEARGHGQNCQFFAVEHYEKVEKHNVHHLHVLASSVRLDGSWVDDSFERMKLKQVERDIELKRGLQYCPPREKGDRNSDPIREWKLREKLQADGKTLIKDDLRGAIDTAATDHPSIALLVAQLKAEGIEVRISEFKDGGKGISYKAEGRAFRGGQLGDRYSFNGLQEYAGVDYQPERDDAMLRQLNEMSAEDCKSLLIQLEQPELERLTGLEQEQSDKTIEQQVELWDATQLVQEIWEHSRAGLPKLKTTAFDGGYQIQLGIEGHPELHRMGETVLERAGDSYQSNGLTQADIEQLQAWQRLTMQQFEERMQRQAAREKEKEKEQQQKESQRQQITIEPKRMPDKAQEIEL
jgi:Relaxase/Mobilisation nuclease domain